ncbi:MAG: hypothetical protein RLY86_491 [Pseudomonadota bacterium]|mgnify:CR=1 FL=1|jgi:cell division protein ZapA (FtsZ GTPase activity inhibitor)
MLIQDLDDLRRDMQAKAAEMREEARRLEDARPDEAMNLVRIADRLDVYMRDFLRD